MHIHSVSGRRLALAARLLLAGLVLGTAAPALAQTRQADLAGATIEDLMNIEITSAAHKQQRVEDVPAAIYVITQDDIRRSGMTTVPELLRLAPGMQVARINANKWAISIHGSNDLYANKLLVLVDGRSIYNRSFSGVWWDGVDLPLGDIERIEIISGSGGSTWGANAVNGIVNIITKSAAQTAGASVTLSAGTFDGTQFSARYGGAVGGLAYRVYSQGSDDRASLGADGVPAGDTGGSLTNGVRVDWSRGANAVTIASSITNLRDHSLWLTLSGPTPNVPPSTAGTSGLSAGTVAATWTHTEPDGTSLSVQSSLDVSDRTDPGVIQNETTADASLIYHKKIGARHDLVTGGGYRSVSNFMSGSFSYALDPPTSDTSVLNVFSQDEISLTKRVRLTLGAKVEHDSVAGWIAQPTVRAMWDVVPGRQFVWGAFSQAARTPSLSDLGLRVNYAAFSTGPGLPVVLGLVGNPDYGTERLTSAEVGYRLLAGSSFSLDITAFRGRYAGLTTIEPLAPVVERTAGQTYLFIGTQFQNLLAADTMGADVAVHWTPVSAWRVDGSYSGLRITPRPDASSRDAAAARFDGNAPTSQWQLHSTTRLGPRAELVGALYHAGALRELGVAPYTRADLRFEFKATGHLSIVGVGQNLQAGAHAEFTSGDTGLMATTVPRSARIQLVWRH